MPARERLPPSLPGDGSGCLVVQQVPFSWTHGVALVMVVLGGGFYSFHVHLEKTRGRAPSGDV